MDSDKWDYIQNESRRTQLDSILSNVLKHIYTSDDYAKFEKAMTSQNIELRTPSVRLTIQGNSKLHVFYNLVRQNIFLINDNVEREILIQNKKFFSILISQDSAFTNNVELTNYIKTLTRQKYDGIRLNNSNCSNIIEGYDDSCKHIS